jgi:hypothetical protein
MSGCVVTAAATDLFGGRQSKKALPGRDGKALAVSWRGGKEAGRCRVNARSAKCVPGGTEGRAKNYASVRYYFDFIDGDRRVDMGGIDLGSDAAARQEAKLRALSGHLPYQLQSAGPYSQIAVRDESGRTVCTVAIKK